MIAEDDGFLDEEEEDMPQSRTQAATNRPAVGRTYLGGPSIIQRTPFIQRTLSVQCFPFVQRTSLSGPRACHERINGSAIAEPAQTLLTGNR